MALVVHYKLSRVGPGIGIGVLTTRPLDKGTLVWQPDDWSIITITEEWLRKQPKALQEKMAMYMYTGQGKHLLRGAGYYSIDDSRFMNHHDNPTLRYDPKDGCYYTLKPLDKNCELTRNYNDFCVRGMYCFNF